jgi:hypothetical protein
MSEHTKTILPLETHQLHQAAEMLSQAFHNDSFLKYSIRDEDKRARLLPSLFGPLIRYALLYGEAYTTPGRRRGVRTREQCTAERGEDL